MAAYKDALNVAVAELPPTNPMRLGLALNFSVFCYEILETPDKAINVAQQAFDDGLAGLDDLSEEDYKDSTLIMQLLRDNITLWKSEEEGVFLICDIRRLDWFTGKFTGSVENVGKNSSPTKDDIPVPPESDESMLHTHDPLPTAFTCKTDSENEENKDKNSLFMPSEDGL